MARYSIVISIVILIASIVLLFDKLFTPQPIQITLQSGQEIITSTSDYFPLTEVLLLIISAFLVGATATYLYYNSDRGKLSNLNLQNSESSAKAYGVILPLLKADEKAVITTLLDSNEQMQQNKLASKLNLSKVKTTRILHRLEQKNLISRERHGFTNMVKLSKQ